MASESIIKAAKAILAIHEQLHDKAILKFIDKYKLSGLRSRGGKTPLRTLNSVLSQNKTIFERVGKARYKLVNPKAVILENRVTGSIKEILQKELDEFQKQISWCVDRNMKIPKEKLTASHDSVDVFNKLYELCKNK